MNLLAWISTITLYQALHFFAELEVRVPPNLLQLGKIILYIFNFLILDTKKRLTISRIRGFIQFLFIPNISRFEFVLKKKEEEKEKKEKEKEKEMEMEKEIEKEKEKEKEMEKEMEKEKEKEVNRGAILCATSLFRSSLPTSYPTGKWTTMKIKLKIGIQIKIPK